MIVRDGEWTLFDHDVKLGRTVWAKKNDDGSTTFRTDYRVDPTIDVNTAQRNLAQPGWKGDYHHVASIPLNVFHAELAEASRQGDERYISKWLNDGSNRAWRTKGGNI
jgi:hypothetical protein